ncbi:MAG: T9SS type A sorting domain-containing protein, partial [Fimbriimonadaceae bacterium]|nr:T9SS type A sorting domain-containing protein [Chitinophagales bacterium]
SGAITYSNVISLTPQKQPSVTSFKIYPNPAVSFVSVESSSASKIFTAVQVTDMLGNVILSSTDISATTPVKTTLDVSNMQTGMYIVTLISKEGNETLPLRVIH